MLRDPGDLVTGGDTVALSAIAEDHPEAKRILASARQILRNLGKADAGRISLADVTDTAKIFAQTKLNGDGIVPPGSAGDEDTALAITQILDCVGGEVDRSGEKGVSTANADAFFAAATAFDAWWKKAEADRDAVLPLGSDTPAAAALLAEVRAKVEDWFARSRLAGFDARAVGPLNRDEAEYSAIAPMLLSSTGAEVASFPLARVVPDGALSLVHGLNPAWADRIHAMRARVIEPLIGARDSLTPADWAAVLAKLDPFAKWSAAKAGAAVEKLGIQRVRELLAGGARERIRALIAEDMALEPEANGIALVEKLVRYQRDLYRLLCNFVSFTDFYSSERASIFQAGTLFLDQRSCELCVRVADAEAHASIATLSKTFLVYCECTRKSDGKKMTIAAAVTGGDSDNLTTGRNGIFYDRQGADWDARVVKIVEHPISIRQSFWLPYKRIGKLIGAQIERFASARDKELHDKAAANIESAAKTVETTGAPVEGSAKAPSPPQAFDVAKFAGIFAAIGLAIGAVGSALAAVTTGFLQLAWWKMPLAILGVMLLVSGPSMVIAWLKLRQRSLGPILDANGWAVNTRAKINLPFGASLTSLAALPKNAERSLRDPFAEDKTPQVAWVAVIALVALVALVWYGGWAESWFDSVRTAVSSRP
ncbi:hypothetical protein [Vulgatibacter incomptus]|uniref:Uncharacterized protein n=1 Tax=Vulgatibacter incomptus TaxID=1391653 RepID=A0A0K1PJ89_9BACT|nr:hypothetical protein [Vulgatibacter incomptus]AKU93169.1 hypothetical protein AKJ08_3556 [Vulgatibacter incomptus]